MANRTVKSIYLMLLCALFALSAQAQQRVTNINTRNAKACREYLTLHPADTLVSVQDVKKGEETIGVVRRLVFLEENSLKAVTDTVFFEETTTDALSFTAKRAYLRGETAVVDPHHKDMEGKRRHSVFAHLLGGTYFIDGEVVPSVTGRLGYETCWFLFELEGSVSRAKYTEQAEVIGHYMTFSANGNVGFKFWQDKLCRSYLALLGTVGYGYQRTDSKSAQFMSENYGLNVGGMIRCSLGLTLNFRFLIEGGYKVTPEVLHDGGNQEMDHGGVFINVGLGYTF